MQGLPRPCGARNGESPRPFGARDDPRQSAAEVDERKTIAGGFCRPFLVENFIGGVVIILVAIKEANHVRLCPGKKVSVEPAENERVSGVPAAIGPFRAVG